MKLYEVFDLFSDSYCDVIVYNFNHIEETEEFKKSDNKNFVEIYRGNILDIPICLAMAESLRAYIEDEHTISILVCD